MILGRILASTSSKDEDDDADEHEDYDNDCWFKFYPKRDNVETKMEDFEIQKWMDFKVQKWFKNEWIWDPIWDLKMDGFGRC